MNQLDLCSGYLMASAQQPDYLEQLPPSFHLDFFSRLQSLPPPPFWEQATTGTVHQERAMQKLHHLLYRAEQVPSPESTQALICIAI